MVEHQRQAMARALKQGVKIVLGTDVGGFPWTELNQAKEFEYYVQYGMSPLAAINRGTSLAAELLGQPSWARSPRGCTRIWSPSPPTRSRTSTELQRVRFVMKGGVRLSFALVRRTLTASLALVIGAAGSAAGQFAPARYRWRRGAGRRLVKQLGANKRILMIGATPTTNTRIWSPCSPGGSVLRWRTCRSPGAKGGRTWSAPSLAPSSASSARRSCSAARRIDGARQFFARAYDFGYSKTIDETLRFWPRDSLLRDVLEVVRRFRPQIIVSVFSGTPSDGHGHHQLAGVLARQAVRDTTRTRAWGR